MTGVACIMFCIIFSISISESLRIALISLALVLARLCIHTSINMAAKPDCFSSLSSLIHEHQYSYCIPSTICVLSLFAPNIFALVHISSQNVPHSFLPPPSIADSFNIIALATEIMYIYDISLFTHSAHHTPLTFCYYWKCLLSLCLLIEQKKSIKNTKR